MKSEDVMPRDGSTRHRRDDSGGCTEGEGEAIGVGL